MISFMDRPVAERIPEAVVVVEKERPKLPPHFEKRFKKLVNHPAFRATNWHCFYCGKSFLEDVESLLSASLDHVVPESLGGTLAHSNVVASCTSCNVLKADLPARDAEEAKRFVEAKRHYHQLLLEAVRYEAGREG